MKKLLHILFLSAGIMASAQKKNIQPSQLPAPALDFLEKYSQGSALHHSYKFTDDDHTRFKVVMADDTEFEFSEQGDWTEVDGKNHAVASGFLPKNIIDYLKKNYPGKRLLKAEKDSKKIEIKLIDGSEVEFDLNGNPIKK
ncbi:PepSY-like domain-containing protein [Flavobacterium silvaticum]|uniref:Putative beta-lactamase-inhibitor-like PepSY-like domain-containing protein n=1 Tax=Flavobacterium silvaticum TaxID=1852020 RepID=A0A972G076_9FLAO|nr:PepSY-like domain-containing protein [Flavobacterium silvaticum]NMH28041.1 hypothetical protein [Flavobacterium silvaticum]